MDPAGRNVGKSQERYKRYFDRKVRCKQTVTKNDPVFADKHPQSEKRQTEQLYGLSRSKLLPKPDGPSQSVFCDGHSVKIREEGIPNTIINRQKDCGAKL